jgi:hypothetical protein
MIWIKIRSSLRLIFLNRPYPQAHAVCWISYLFPDKTKAQVCRELKRPVQRQTYLILVEARRFAPPRSLAYYSKAILEFWQRGIRLRSVETEEMTIAYSECGHVVNVFTVLGNG